MLKSITDLIEEFDAEGFDVSRLQLTLTVDQPHDRERLGNILHKDLLSMELHPRKMKWDKRTVLTLLGVPVRLAVLREYDHGQG